MEPRNALISRFRVDLPATATFDYPTVTALAGYIAAHTEESAAPDTVGAAERMSTDGQAAVDLRSIRSAQAANYCTAAACKRHCDVQYTLLHNQKQTHGRR